MIALSLNRLKRNGRTAGKASGPPRLNSTTAVFTLVPHTIPLPVGEGGKGMQAGEGHAPPSSGTVPPEGSDQVGDPSDVLGGRVRQNAVAEIEHEGSPAQ